MTEKTELHIEQEDIFPIKKTLINRPKGGYCTPLQEALESDEALFECFRTNIETTIMDAYNTRDWPKTFLKDKLL